MLLPPEDAAQFLSLYQHLIGFVAGRLGGVEGIVDFATFRAASIMAKGRARDRLSDNIGLIDAFVEANPGEFRETDLSLVLLWRHFLRGDFFVERDLAGYTVFLTRNESVRAYGVLGLTTEIVELVHQPLPALVHAVLLPWKGRIVCDGMIGPYNIIFGGGIRASLRDAYRRAKVAGVITSLEPGWQPSAPQTPKPPKTPAIHRFLRRKCPATVEEFRRRYGPPALLRTGTAAREFGPRRLGATEILEFDTLAVYPNLLRNQVLYLYIQDGRIVAVTATERTSWSKADLKPPPGHTLLR